MLNSKKNVQNIIESGANYRSDTTIIGSGANFNGTLNSSGIIRIDGNFEGEINIDGNVIVGESGRIKGNIKASKITIAGTVEGNIHCNGTLVLMASGKLYGDTEVKGISIEDGALFDGKCMMIKQSAAPENEALNDDENHPADEN